MNSELHSSCCAGAVAVLKSSHVNRNNLLRGLDVVQGRWIVCLLVFQLARHISSVLFSLVHTDSTSDEMTEMSSVLVHYFAVDLCCC